MQEPRSLPDALDALRDVHIIGVGGTLMGAFAVFLKRMGVQVSGSDQNLYPPMSDVLKGAQVKLFSGYRAENVLGLDPKPQLVVIGNVIRPDNPEALAAIGARYPFASLPEVMEKLLLSHTKNLVVTGTHGKTTTSSLLAFVLSRCGRRPNYFIGGVSKDLPHSFHIETLEPGTAFVLEGDEYDTAFWDKVPKFNHYRPDDVILTSIEYDHADIYPDLVSVVRAFEGLLKRIRPNGKLIACWDYSEIRNLVKQSLPNLDQCKVLSYSRDPNSGAQYALGSIANSGERFQFEILEDRKYIDQLQIQLPGFHNALNALAVWIQCRELGLGLGEIKGAIAEFQGVMRRQEVKADIGGIVVIDDFAHHPSAVRETLLALQLKYPGRRFMVAFEPRSATSRRKIFQKEYVSAFLIREGTIWIAKPYDQSRIAAQDMFSSEQLVEDLRRVGKEARILENSDLGAKEIVSSCRRGDVIIVLSNGDFGGLTQKIITELRSS